MAPPKTDPERRSSRASITGPRLPSTYASHSKPYPELSLDPSHIFSPNQGQLCDALCLGVSFPLMSNMELSQYDRPTGSWSTRAVNSYLPHCFLPAPPMPRTLGRSLARVFRPAHALATAVIAELPYPPNHARRRQWRSTTGYQKLIACAVKVCTCKSDRCDLTSGAHFSVGGTLSSW